MSEGRSEGSLFSLCNYMDATVKKKYDYTLITVSVLAHLYLWLLANWARFRLADTINLYQTFPTLLLVIALVWFVFFPIRVWGFLECVKEEDSSEKKAFLLDFGVQIVTFALSISTILGSL